MLKSFKVFSHLPKKHGQVLLDLILQPEGPSAKPTKASASLSVRLLASQDFRG